MAPYVAYLCGFSGCVFCHCMVRCVSEASLLVINNESRMKNGIGLKSAARRNKVSNNNNSMFSTATATANFYKRRTSLPTIPFKFDKVIYEKFLLEFFFEFLFKQNLCPNKSSVFDADYVNASTITQ